MTVLKAKIGGTFQSVLAGYASNVFVGPNPPTDPNVQFWVDTDAYLPIVPWIPLPMQTDWSNLGAGYSLCGYRKVGDKVEVRGIAIATAGNSVLVATLPVGFRPPGTNLFNTLTQDVGGRLEMRASGEIHRITGPTLAAGTWVSLDVVEFSVTA